MGVTFEQFQQLANATFFTSRDIVVDANNSAVKLGNLLFSSGKNTNKATMKAFRTALAQRYGVFGEHAFDTVIGMRAQLQKSLRACDVKAVFSNLETLKQKRFINELARQLDTDPKVRELSKEMRQAVRDNISESPYHDCHLASCHTPLDIARMASNRIAQAIGVVQAEVAPGRKLDTTTHSLNGRKEVETSTRADEPIGLRNLKTVFKKGQTSIEDKVKLGDAGVGMRINRSTTNPVLLHALKTNGVEPGFIYKNDWSLDDTRGFLADTSSAESRAALAELKKNNATLARNCGNKPLREQIMLCGRQHPAGMAAVAEYMLEEGMQNENSTIYRAFCDKFPNKSPNMWKTMDLRAVKKALFVEIREAVMGVRPGNAAYGMSPIFKHFNDRHIVKLDYNEGNRIFTKHAASAGKFMRPERVKVGRKMGQLYRLQTATTADKSSAGAVTEALANDLTRLAGIPSQELSIVRGQYSDGHPKLMLEAKFAEGYKDMENGYIKDGQIVPPNGESVQRLGKYKAFFLVTADRDAVGSRGQNKGFVQGQDGQPGTFLAIDPGHSLEGNGRFLEVDDNFSFKDTYGFSTKPRFKNFSVFDDDTRFAKFQGALELRTLQQSGKVETLFSDYRNAFNPNEQGISPSEKTLRLKIAADIDKKEAEFKDSMAKVLTVAENQFKLYDDLAQSGPVLQEKAIETLENLEKLTSPTTWVSPRGEVPLKHLAVIPETRVAWRAHVDGDNIIYHCDQPLTATARSHLKALAATSGATLEIDAEGCARLTIAKAGSEHAFDVFSEQNVSNLTHTEEAAARAMGGTGLAEAQHFAAARTASVATASTPPFALPEQLTVHVGNDTLTFRREHYEAMLANTPKAERPRTLQELQNILAVRIQRGRDIFRSVMQGKGHRYAATPRNVACLTLALHAGTVKKGEYNERGAFSVEDPDGKLYHWLDTCKELYLRTSTHARAYQQHMVDGHKNMPRGLDIPEGMGGLMGGMRTLHYLTLPQIEGGRQKRRLFLKCETYGIYRSTITKADEEASRVPGMQTRQKRVGDTRESLKHCFSLFTVITRRGPGEGNRKETTPKVILDATAAAQRSLRHAGLGNLADILGKDVKGGGLRQLVNNFTKVLDMAPDDATVRKGIIDILEVAENYVEADAHRSGEEANRMGNEVMLEAREIL